MKSKTIYITHDDLTQLQSLLHQDGVLELASHQELQQLKQELLRAKVVASQDLPPDVVTINSRVRLRQLDDDSVETYTLVMPGEANFEEGRISVLAPLGAAMLGYRAGNEFEWQMPRGVRRFRVERVLFQPEASERRKAAV